MSTRPRPSVAGSVGAIERHHGPDDPRLPDLRRELRAVTLEEHIKRVVDEAPPLSAETRARLASILLAAPSGNGGAV